MQPFNYASLGQVIRERRKAKGLSQEALAKAASVARSQLSHIEQGKGKDGRPSIETLQKIASVLNCEIEVILTPKTIKQ
jgi:transcriptional regulator with XRE-family HTH domain